MQIMEIATWEGFKSLIAAKELLIQYSETNREYNIFASEASVFLWTISLLKNDSDAQDFEENFKSTANRPLEYRSDDGLVKVASAKFVESLGFYLTGEATQADLSANNTAYIKYHFDDSYTLSGVVASWKDSNFGDYLDFEIGVYTDEESEETFISLNKFATQFKIMDTGHVTFDVPTVKTVPSKINIGFGEVNVFIRIKATNVGSAASKVIVNLVGWV